MSRLSQIASSFAVLVVLVGLSASLEAQEAKADKDIEIHPDFEKSSTVSTARTAKTQLLSNRQTVSDVGDIVKRWYTDYELRLFTQKEHFGDLTEIRLSIARDLARARDNQQTHQFLVDTIYPIMTALVKGDFYQK